MLATPYSRGDRMEIFWDTVINQPDQFRQRVALAYSHIFVVSDQVTVTTLRQLGIASYHDTLAIDAFKNFRVLLEDITLHPVMGRFLDMVGNGKGDPAAHTRADENYAREIMQLFTIGTVKLNPDGTVVTDANGVGVPTYSQADVEGLARVLTGWSWDGPSFRAYTGLLNEVDPLTDTLTMIPFESFHDSDPKQIVGGVTVNGGSARADLKVALDTLFAHPNVGPFIGRQLIQRLVMSNPSPAYVARVAAVFADNGQGVRGDMAAVLRAIMLDPEARSPDAAGVPASTRGRMREPLLQVAHLFRTFSATSPSGKIQYLFPLPDIGQAPFMAPSVFNFFRPLFAPPGPIKQAGLVAPEFQLHSPAGITLSNNYFASAIFNHDVADAAHASNDAILLDLSSLKADPDPAVMLDKINLLVMNGQMPAAMRTTLIAYLTGIDATHDGGSQRAQEALYLIFTSSQYAIQK